MCLNTQFMKVLWSYNFQTCNNIWKFLKTQLKQITFHNLQSHLVCWHAIMFILIRYTICKYLLKIKYFRHKCSSILYENTWKHNKIKWPSITCSHICDKFCESLVTLGVTKHKYHSFFWYYFRHRAMFWTCPNKESRKSKFLPL